MLELVLGGINGGVLYRVDDLAGVTARFVAIFAGGIFDLGDGSAATTGPEEHWVLFGLDWCRGIFLKRRFDLREFFELLICTNAGQLIDELFRLGSGCSVLLELNFPDTYRSAGSNGFFLQTRVKQNCSGSKQFLLEEKNESRTGF